MDKYIVNAALRGDLKYCVSKFEEFEKRLTAICLSESPRDIYDDLQVLIVDLNFSKNLIKDYYFKGEAC